MPEMPFNLSPRAKAVLRIGAFILGGALTAGAVVFAARGLKWEQLADAHWWQIALIAGGVVVNLLLTGLLWWLVTRSFDADPPVPLGRMTVLIAGCELLNYLPLRAGLVGRTAYLKSKHRVPVRQSVVMVFATMGLTGIVFTAVAAALLVTATPWRWALMGGVVVMLCALGPWLAPRLLRRPVYAAWAWPLVRVADLLTASARLWIALDIVGQPVPFADALLAAAAGLLVRPISLTPNALGLREWFVGLVAGAMATGAFEAGVAAALVDRAAELAVMTVAGLASLALLRKWGWTTGEDQESTRSGD